jgi:hypothetical protein
MTVKRMQASLKGLSLIVFMGLDEMGVMDRNNKAASPGC